MYDLNAKSWGGGDRFEGCASSIYSGWTNAPISIVTAFEILGESLDTLGGNSSTRDYLLKIVSRGKRIFYKNLKKG